MAALDEITGLIPVVIGAGIVMKVTEKVLPQQQGKLPKRSGKKQTRKPNSIGFGDFRNIGL